MRRVGTRLIVLLGLSGWTGVIPSGATDSATSTRTAEVVLPPFIVDGSDAPPWLYARGPDFELLSRCPVETTNDVLVSYARARSRLDLLLPSTLRGRTEAAELVLLYDAALWARGRRDAVRGLLKETDAVRNRGELNAVQMSFPPNLRLSDADMLGTFILVGGRVSDVDASVITPVAVAQLMAARVPRLPGWFTAGFLALYPRVEFRDGGHRFLRMEGLEGVIVRAADDGRAGRRLAVPLARVLDDATTAGPVDPSLRLAEVELFVRWGLDPGSGRAARFFECVDRVAAGEAGETAVDVCFGMRLDDVESALIEYAGIADRDGSWSVAAASPADAAAAYPVREATRVDVARIKGEWERLEARYVAKAASNRLGDYVRLARRSLENADQDDAGVAGSLGLLELEFGSKDRARDLLETAAGAGSRRTRVYFELARLRLEECLATSRRSDGRLDFDATRSVLHPLETAARLEPRLVQVYQLMANVWDNSAVRPSLAALGDIQDGVRLFPQDVELLYQAALAYRRAGDATRSRRLAERGLALEGGASGSRFVALLQAPPPDIGQ